MKTLVTILVITLVFGQEAVAGYSPAKKCTRRNEEYSECGSACPLTCENYENPPICIALCVSGCFCKNGYVRNESGDCVTPCQCPKIPQCPANEKFYECGTACPLTCTNYQSPPEACILMCVEGCQCAEGYVRNEADGKCCLPSECPRCPANEKFNPCGNSCPLTCENYKNPPKICNRMCNVGCECVEGYVGNKMGNCVLPCDC